jgi:hypothetical protein
MSTWGVGNFDNDMAGEVLVGVVFQLVKVIQDCLDDEDSAIMCGETDLMPSVDILLTLGKSYRDIVLPALKEFSVGEWKKRYLDIFDNYSEITRDKEFMAARRPIVVQTFTELESLVQSHTY